MAKQIKIAIKVSKKKKNGKGIHAKSGTSTNKNSKNYKKPSRGQG